MLQSLKNALPIVAAALGRKFGVEVGVGGHEAMTNGQRIQIPQLPDDPASRDLAWGYLAHEAAHVRYTDFDVYAAAAREGALQTTLQNRIEDVRIERALARPYPGTRVTIAAVLGRMLHEGRLSAPDPGDHPAQVLAAYLLLALRHEVLGQAVLATEARKAGDTLRQVFPAPFIARLRALMGEVAGLTSTAEAVDLARRIRRMIEEQATAGSPGGAADEGGQPPEPSTAGDEDDTDSRQPGSGQEELAECDQADGAGAPEGDAPIEHAEADSESVPVRDGDGPSGSPQGPGNRQVPVTEKDPAPDDPANSAGPETATPSSGKSVQTDDAAGRETLAAVLSAGAGDCAGDLFTEVASLLRAGASHASPTVLPLPEDYAGNPLAGMQLLARVQAESARLSARLQGLVQASRMDRPRPVRSGRRLDPRRLHRIGVADQRIFARRTQRVAPNTAVHLLVDLSGSMSAPVERSDGTPATRAESALESALALALALGGIAGVTVAVSAFPGIAGRSDRVARMLRHGQTPRACAGAFIQHPRGGTPMAQALWYAAGDLLACREERRLLVVLTDGEPDDSAEVLRLLALCREAAIEAVGVGIGIDVRHLFATAIEVGEAKDLKCALFGVAERLLVGAAA